MMATFVCPECGRTSIGSADWKQWCAEHEVTMHPGSEMRRRLVEMVPETVYAKGSS